MTLDARDAARVLGKALVVDARRPVAGARGVASRLACRALRPVALAPLARRLGASPEAERRELAAMLAAALAARNYGSVPALAATAGHRPDARAEKILSRRRGYLWICNPKAASRSMIAALRTADPNAVLVRGLDLDQVLARYPEARTYWRFAFLRHPWRRTWSFHADKHALALHRQADYRWFVAAWHGLRPGISFPELCAWLNTPAGSDAFADRHWLSQSRQIVGRDGRLPDFLGSYENLAEDWRYVAERLGLPCATLPHLNARPSTAAPEPEPDGATLALLRRRYAEDFRLGGYGEDG